MESRIKCIHLYRKIAFSEENGTNSHMEKNVISKLIFKTKKCRTFNILAFTFSRSITFLSQMIIFSPLAKHYQLIVLIDIEIV